MSKARTRKAARGRPRSRSRRPGSPSVSALPKLGLPVPLPEVSFPVDLLGLEGPERTEIGLDIVFRLPRATRYHRVPVRVTRRLSSPSRVELWGTALSGTFDMHLSGTRENRWRMQSRVRDTEMDGRQMLAVLDLLEAATAATGVGLALPGQTPSTWTSTSTATLDGPPPELRSVIEAHAEVERRLQVPVVASLNYAPTHARDTLESAALLRGETVGQTWTERQWEMDADEAAQLLEGAFADGGEAKVELEEDWYWSAFSGDRPIGTVAVAYESVRVTGTVSQSKTRTLTLKPGSSDTVTFRLTSVNAFHPEVGNDANAGTQQRWFWEHGWQQREAEVDDHVRAGRVLDHHDAAAFLDHLDGLDHDGDHDRDHDREPQTGQ